MSSLHRAVRSDGRIQLTVVTGYLGAGKTTWLAKTYAASARRTLLVVNDAGDFLPDTGVFAGFEVVTIGGGCACCERRQELVDTLRALCRRRHAGMTPIDSVLLETSGVADPSAVTAAIRQDPVLVNNVVVREVVAVVDAQRVVSGLRHTPLVARQLGVADRVVVAKGDLTTRAQATAAVAAIRAAAPAAGVELAPDPHHVDVATVPPRPVEAAADAEDEQLRVLSLPVAPDQDWAAVASWLAALLNAHGAAIVRVKGLVPTYLGPLVLNAVAGVMHPPRIAEPLGESAHSLVFVVRGLDPVRLADSWNSFRAASLPTVLDRSPSEVC